ncbi:hypothetical protein [Levilactobacillus cerevisiae]|uniref:hypothetical protein n=1 Tax=Levilactobacillus cerevisiae TaxID=1704076 RepID=UPI0013DDFCED|nr:hypothetical protein [Levilactobacillus cerevisiae]
MDIWEQLYQAAKPLYHPEAVNEFIYAHNVVCALQSKSGQILGSMSTVVGNSIYKIV